MLISVDTRKCAWIQSVWGMEGRLSSAASGPRDKRTHSLDLGLVWVRAHQPGQCDLTGCVPAGVVKGQLVHTRSAGGRGPQTGTAQKGSDKGSKTSSRQPQARRCNLSPQRTLRTQVDPTRCPGYAHEKSRAHALKLEGPRVVSLPLGLVQDVPMGPNNLAGHGESNKGNDE